MTAVEIIEALRRYHQPPAEWAFFDELRCGVGFNVDSEKRIDAWAIHCFRQPVHKGNPKGNALVAYEVKVSRSDWLREFKVKPYSIDIFRDEPKRAAAMRVSNLFYFAVPAHLVKPIEVPEDSGLVYVGSDGKVTMAKPAPYRAIERIEPWFLAAVARRAMMAQNGHTGRNVRLPLAAGPAAREG